MYKSPYSYSNVSAVYELTQKEYFRPESASLIKMWLVVSCTTSNAVKEYGWSKTFVSLPFNLNWDEDGITCSNKITKKISVSSIHLTKAFLRVHKLDNIVKHLYWCWKNTHSIRQNLIDAYYIRMSEKSWHSNDIAWMNFMIRR